MKKPKTKTSRNQAHTPKSPKGMGDYYGTGIRQKVGRIRVQMGMTPISSKKMKTAPKSLA